MSDKQDTREMLVSGNVFKTMLTLSVPVVKFRMSAALLIQTLKKKSQLKSLPPKSI